MTSEARPAHHSRPIVDPDRARIRLQQAVDRLERRSRVPHVVLGVATGDGSFRWVGAAGPAGPDGTLMRPDTTWFVASVTKLYIATTVLQLCERGEVGLDAPMTAFLATGSVDGIHRLGGVDHTPAITIRHLLGHTSGLPDYLEDRPRGGRSWYRQLAAGHDRSWDFDEMVHHVRDQLEPHFPPRDLGASRVRARYSDTNFQLLIAVIESVTGQAVDAVFEERLFGPLGMRHTWLPGRPPPSGATGLEPATLWSKGRPLELPRAFTCFNDLVSTADDQLRFMVALSRGAVFDDPATYRLFGERWNRIFYPMRYGLGMMRYPIGRPFAPGRRPATFVGHSGASGSGLFHCPELDVVITGTVDELGSRALPFRFFPRVLRALYR
jgi:D-alanyl-D-alanine carboxypeptidase